MNTRESWAHFDNAQLVEYARRSVRDEIAAWAEDCDGETVVVSGIAALSDIILEMAHRLEGT